jgi:hypothetical protein
MRMAIPSLLVLVLASSGCQGKTETTTKTDTKTQTKTETKVETKVEEKSPPPAVEAKAAPAADAPPSYPGDETDPLGKRFIDPTWFRKELFANATSTKVSRSQRNEQGLFSSQILFDLPAGTTAEQCAETLMDQVRKEVPNLAKSDDPKSPGRLQIRGSTDRYNVTMMCGDAKGTMRAYVSFEWTKP